MSKQDYIDEYRTYVKEFAEDKNSNITELENFQEWLEEEKYEEKIRCKCGSFNTFERIDKKGNKFKFCEDCNHSTKITPTNIPL